MHTFERVLRIGGVALAMLVGIGVFAPPATAAATQVTKRCVGLERRLDVRLRREIGACTKVAGATGRLACASRKRDRHVEALGKRRCQTPAWAIEVDVFRAGEDTVALRWQSRLNWARLLDRKDEPIASAVRVAGDRFENLLLLGGATDVATVVDYLQDVEARAVDVVNGLPTELDGPGAGRGSFPRAGDYGPIEAADTFLDVIEACEEGAPNMFAERALGGVSRSRDANDFSGAGDNGNRGLTFSYIVADLVNAILADDPPENDTASDDPPADDEQCADDAEGSCTEGEEDADAEQSKEGTDDPEGTPAPEPSPSGGDPALGESTCARDADSFISFCESSGWQTPSCRAFVQFANGCADDALINPDPEADVPCTGDGMSEAEYRELECEAKRGIMVPAPDGELRCSTIDLGRGLPNLAPDPCNGTETQGTSETCDARGGIGGADIDTQPPVPGPDPRGSRLGGAR